MQHNITAGLALVKIYDLTPEENRDLREHLRLELLNGNCGQHMANGDDKSYVGLQSPVGAKKIEDWLIQNGSTVKE